MKNLSLLIVLLPVLCSAQGSCGSRFAPVFSLSPGYSKGVSFGMEAGLYPTNSHVGVTAGLLLRNQEIIGEKGTVEKAVVLDVCGRILYKLTAPGCEQPQVITAFATLSGLAGISYRYYLSIGNDLVGIEPNYTNRNGFGANLVFTFHL